MNWETQVCPTISKKRKLTDRAGIGTISEFSEKFSLEAQSQEKYRRKLGWERTKLWNLKARIDESHNESQSDKQRRTSARVTTWQEICQAAPLRSSEGASRGSSPQW